MTSQVVIVGCGVGGLVLSNRLAGKVKGRARITVIERKSRFEFAPSFPWLMVGARNAEQVQRSLNVLDKKGINHVQDEVSQISLDNRSQDKDGQLRI